MEIVVSKGCRYLKLHVISKNNTIGMKFDFMNEIRKHIFLGLFSFPAVGINQMSKAHQSAVL